MKKHTNVSQIMSTNIISVSDDDLMTKVRDILNEAEFHHIPVVKDNQVVGMISSTDIHRLESTFSFFKNDKTKAYNDAVFNSLLVSDVMHSNVQTIDESEAVDQAYKVFKKNVLHCLPVVSQTGKLVGIVTPYDLLKFAFE